MATKVNFYENYGDKSARERAELIYSNYSSFQGIIEDCKMRLIYEIKAEKERRCSNHKDELGVRIQNLGSYSNPTADEAVLDVMLEGAINGLNSAEDALSDPALVQEFKRREYVIVMMADEYASFRRHLHALSVKEQEIIIPAINEMAAKGMLCYGPYPADGFMGSDNFTHFDGILAMYHDQGLAPFKALAMDEGVNYTAGLPVIRTSPAHGTAYDIAGKGIASEDSFRQAIYVAIDVFRNRQREKEAHANPLRKQYYEKRDDSDKLKLDSVEEDL